MRVHELAKKLDVPSKDIIAILEKKGVQAKNHMATIPESMMADVEKEAAHHKPAASKKETAHHAESADHKETHHKKEAVHHPEAAHKEAASHKTEKHEKEKAAEKSAEKKESENKKEAPHAKKAKTVKKPDVPAEDAVLEPEAPPAELPDEDLESKFQVSLEKVGRRDVKKEKRLKAKPKEKNEAGARIDKISEREITPTTEIKVEGPVEFPHNPTVKEFSEAMNQEPNNVIGKLFSMGVIATINQSLDDDTVQILGHELGLQIKFKEEKPVLIEKEQIPIVEESVSLESRPPVVTFMGHVDHGKTSLLDKVRNSDVAKHESGGITQHIGASTVDTAKGKIVFLDTPGHEAFTEMRAMGANVTDIAVLVVAADDGIMPQTIEAINHAREAEVPIIVAINKVDKPEANVERVKIQLADHKLNPEDWGGDTICVPVSAITGQGIDQLLDMILLQAEILELKANPKGQTLGIIIESEINDRVGPMATAIIKNGTLKRGDAVISGYYFGKVKKMLDDKGKSIDAAGPSTPVKIIGLNGAPDSGTQLRVISTEKEARDMGNLEQEKKRLLNLERKDIVTLENIYSQIEEGKKKDLKVILKADVSGSVHAITSSLEKMKSDKINIKLIHRGTGSINDSDVTLADASGAIIIGFHVSIVPSANEIAKERKVQIKLYDIIYTALDDIRSAMLGMLDPEIKEENLGKAEVKQIFKISKVGLIAGCFVTEGKVMNSSFARVYREGQNIVKEARVTTLKHYKDEVKEAKAGNECGIRLEGFDTFKEGDLIEFFEKVKIKQTL
jgi:translation initiation factor IF-2